MAAMSGLSCICAAQDKTAKGADPYAFSIKLYRMPADDLATGFVSKERGTLRAPTMPPASASGAEQEVFLKRSHEVMQEYLSQQGIVLPKGSLACYDPASETLALRAMTVVHDMVGPFVTTAQQTAPASLNWAADIVEAPAAAVRAAMKEAEGKADHSAVFEHLADHGKVVVTMRGETKSGVRTRSSQGGRAGRPSEYTMDNDQRVTGAINLTDVGTVMEFDPTLGPDARTIDVTLDLHHNYGRPRFRWEPLTTATNKPVEARWMDLPSAQVSTSITLLDQTSRLLGVWTVDDAEGPPRAGAMQAAFLRMTVVRAQPLEDRRAEQLLKAHGEAVEPTPKAVRPVADPSLPPGMIVRRFRIPSDFLSNEPAAMKEGVAADRATPSHADPFGKAEPRDEPRFMRHVTAEDILRAAGIPFPDGASANFLPSSSELVVRNTPANIERVENYVSSLALRAPTVVALSLHVVQADAALIRRLDRESMALPDHAAAWKMLEQAVAQSKAKIVRSMWLGTKSGVEATVSNAVLFDQNADLQAGTARNNTSETKPDEGKGGPVAKASVVNNNGEDHSLVASEQTTPVGLLFRLNPTVGPDDKLIDLLLSFEYDTAPPVQNLVKESPPEHVQRLATPTTEFYRTSAATTISLLSGATRLLSVWKPAGAPEFDADILQAAFLRAEVVKVVPDDKAAAK